MLKSRWIYFVAISIHMFCAIVFLGDLENCYLTPFFGATYYGDVKFYANSVFLFSIFLLYGFGETRRYISGYGILQMMRSLERKIVARNILINQFAKVVILTSVLYVSFLIECFMMGCKISNVNIGELFVKIILFIFVMYSIMLWQSLFEVIWDERIAIGAVLCFVIIQIVAGNMVYINRMNENLNLLLYVNLYATLRTDCMRISVGAMMRVLACICVLQSWLLHKAISKKDIFQMQNS